MVRFRDPTCQVNEAPEKSSSRNQANKISKPWKSCNEMMNIFIFYFLLPFTVYAFLRGFLLLCFPTHFLITGISVPDFVYIFCYFGGSDCI